MSKIQQYFIRKQYKRRFLKPDPYEAWLGKLGDGHGIVVVPTNTNYRYVRPIGSDQVLVVHKGAASDTNDAYVWVGRHPYRPDVLAILALDPIINQAAAGIEAHKDSHFLDGSDPVFIDTRQIVNLLAVPAGTSVTIYGGWVIIDGTPVHVSQQTLDLSSNIPVTGALWGLIRVSSAGVIDLQEGAALDAYLDLQFDALPAIATSYAALWGVKLYAGQEIISRTTTAPDLVDLRFAPMSVGLGSMPASSVTTVITNFDGILSAADDTVQKALDTLDDYYLTSGPTGWYDVTKYGAAGDGTTDDTSAVQAAIDAAHTAGGGIVWLPPGNYSCSELTGYREVSIMGAGKWVAKIVARDASQAHMLLYSYPGSVDPASRFTGFLSDFSLDGDDKAIEGLSIDTGFDLIVFRMGILSCTSKGISLAAVLIATFRDCTIESCGIGINGTQARGTEANLVRFRDCRITRHDQWAIHWDGGSDVTVDSCEIENNAKAGTYGGIYFKGHLSNGIQIHDCWFESNKGAADVYLDTPEAGENILSTVTGSFFRSNDTHNYSVYVKCSSGQYNKLVIRESKVYESPTIAHYCADGVGATVELHYNNGTTQELNSGIVTEIAYHDQVSVLDTATIDLSLSTQQITANLKHTTVSPGTYNNANITVDSTGRLTAASGGGGGELLVADGFSAPPILVTNEAEDDFLSAG